MPCLMCESKSLFNESAFCVDCYRVMFPKHARNLLGEDITTDSVAKAVVKWIWNAEEKYGKTMMYVQDLTGEEAKNKSLRAKGFQGGMRGLVPTVLSSTAIRQFFDGELTVCECHSLMMAIYYRALLDLLGDSLFENVFSGQKMTLFTGVGLQFSSVKDPWQGLMSKYNVNEDGSNVQVGDWIYFTNRPDYKAKHPGGAAAGWNVVCVSTKDEPRYMGFGLTGVTENEDKRAYTGRELCQILLDYHNAPPDEHDLEFKKGESKGLTGDVDLLGLALSKQSKGKFSLEPHIDVSVPGHRLNVGQVAKLKQ